METIAPTSDEMLLDIQDSVIGCQELFRQLSEKYKRNTDDGIMASTLSHDFNGWAAHMGLFHTGQPLFTTQLKALPDISQRVQNYLAILEHNIGKVLFPTDSNYDSSSIRQPDDLADRLSTSPHSHHPTSRASPWPQPTAWISSDVTLTFLCQLGKDFSQDGARLRQERFQRFKNLGQNKPFYQQFEGYVRGKVDNLFPNMSEVLRERIAMSIGIRRARLQYLEQDQETSTFIKRGSKLLISKDTEGGNSILLVTKQGQEHAASLGLVVSLSEIPSNTVDIKVDSMRSNSSQNETPRADHLAEDANRPNRRRISMEAHKLEPFFCVFDDCSSPFTCTESYTDWLEHMREEHTIPKRRCWYHPELMFSNAAEARTHLEGYHQDRVPTESLRSTAVKYSKARDIYPLKNCPFCGRFPIEIERFNPSGDDVRIGKSLFKHIKAHLISIARTFPPFDSGEVEELRRQFDDAKSGDTGNNSEPSIDRIADFYRQYHSCDYNGGIENTSFGNLHDVEHGVLDMPVTSNFTEPRQDIMDEKTRGNRTKPILISFIENIGLTISYLYALGRGARNRQPLSAEIMTEKPSIP